jgi:hypothetical protein
MAYLKPPVFAKKVFNPLAMRLGVGGSAELVVRRRKSGDEQRIPVIPVDVAGTRYLVSTRGESDWVRNIRESGRAELRGKHETGSFRATELPLEQRAPVIAAYREKAGKTVETYWKKLPDDSDHPVFRLEA